MGTDHVQTSPSYIISFCHIFLARILVNSSRNSGNVSYVDGSSRTEPQVCAMGRLANPSKVENWTEISGTQRTSAPVTYLKKELS